MRAGRVAVLAAVLPLSGCAAMVGGYDLAPNGLTGPEDALRRDLATRAPVTYRSITEGKRELPGDDLLRLLYAGIAGRYAGAYEESSHLLDVASYLAEDRVTTSVSRQLASFITNDRALAYVPGRTERLMIPYISAVNYLAAGDADGAAVEARRIEALLDKFDEDEDREDAPAESRFLHYFAGTVFEAARDVNAADVAYRRAGPLAEAVSPGQPEKAANADSLGDVVVLVERGFVPHRVEQSVVVVIPPFEVDHLTGGSPGERATVAGEAAVRILATAAGLYGDRSSFYHDRGFERGIRLAPWADACADGGQCGDDDDDEDSAPYLLRISWPVLYQEMWPPSQVRVRSGDYAADGVAWLDLSEATRADFDAERPTMLARTVVRAAAKVAISAGVKEAVSKKDETAGEVAGILTNLGTMLTERADTRCWQLLPGSITMVRMRLPAGTHELTLEAGDAGTPDSSVYLGPVEVRPGEIAFVATRLWR